ncbi:cellulase family glycosylhydrolase [Gracilibacillus suaedae]|uniref:cellulase family glycosylhydrolase n=1 Tax=Gracilibacillus suaedae TaxID=2820273 RepID=UPI001ABE6B2C|nr:cellulase family glycosylhydrolase [Gracilibacillus suaedae]
MKKKFTLTMLIFVVLLSITSITTFAEETPTEEINIQTYAENMQPGWNLGNTYDAVGEDETAWGNPFVTKDLIKKIADEGFKSIRIPITFDQRMAESGDYQIDEDFLIRVDQTVQWALEEDLYVMINIHHDSWIWIESGMQENHDQTVERFNAIWTQLADRFKDDSTKLMFESINEPRFLGTEEESQQYLDELNTHFYQIVRESGGNNDIRPLVLPTLDTGSEPEKITALYNFINSLEDPNIIATVHYYGFWPFSVNIAGYTRFEQDTKEDIHATFDRVHDTFTANGIPTVIGEYGLLGFDVDTGVIQQGEKLKFFEYMLHYAQEKDLVHMLWDNGQHLDRDTLEWSDQQFFNMVQTSWHTRSAVPNDNFIYLKESEEITDKPITFELHGNNFEEIYLADQLLEEGGDYQIEANTITFSKELLSSLITENDLGTVTTLTVTFTGGVDWDIEVEVYQTPELEETEGTTSEFLIPTRFNGDQLATMEAYYQDGSFAGPQNWTAFKEFGYAFAPDYEEGFIELKDSFFNEVEDGEVDLTFHFWSGETIDYTVVKDGESVTTLLEEEPVEEEPIEEGVEEDDHTQEESVEEEETTVDEESKSTDSTDDSNQEDTFTAESEENNTKSEDTTDPYLAPDHDENNRLPDTATAQFNYMGIGLGLVLIGVGSLTWYRKTKVK